MRQRVIDDCKMIMFLSEGFPRFGREFPTKFGVSLRSAPVEFGVGEKKEERNML